MPIISNKRKDRQSFDNLPGWRSLCPRTSQLNDSVRNIGLWNLKKMQHSKEEESKIKDEEW